MYLDFIKENIDYLINNIDNVLYIRPYDIEFKRALFAVISDEKGIYKKLQLTKAVSRVSFPFQPIRLLNNNLNNKHFNNFITFYNYIAFNTQYLDGFEYKLLNDNTLKYGIYGTFIDGSETFIEKITKKVYRENDPVSIYKKELSKYKRITNRLDDYQIIEDNMVDNDTFVISSLKEKSKVKKLTK